MAHFQLRDTLISDRRLPMPGRVVVFGCTLDADVPIQHESVSERHALLEVSTDSYMLSDLGSAEGTFVRERRLAPGERCPLAEGGSFRLGKIEVILASDEEVQSSEDEEMHLEPEVEAALRAPPPAVPAASRVDVPVGEVPRSPDSQGAGRKGSRLPAARRRAEKLRSRRTAVFWAGIALTAVLLALAAFFIYRIANQKGSGSAKESVEQPSR